MQFHGMTRIHRLLSMKMMTMTTTQKTLTCALVTVRMSWMTLHGAGTPTDDPELMAIWKMLMRPHLKCMLRHIVVGIGAFDGLAQPSTDRKPCKVSWQRQERQEERKVLFSERWKTDKFGHLAFCQKHRAHVSSLVLRCPRSARLRLVQLVVDHIMLLVSVLISWKTLIWYLCSGCAVFDSQCYGATVEEIKTRRTLKILLHFQSRVWRSSPLLTVEPRRQFLDS